MRTRGTDICSVLGVFSLPIAVFAIFPLEALFPSARVPGSVDSQPEPFAVFVTLTPEEESAALGQAKSTLNAVVGSYAPTLELILRDLPESARPPVLDVTQRTCAPQPAVLSVAPTPYLPSLASPPPAVIPRLRDEPQPTAFTREELLRIR